MTYGKKNNDSAPTQYADNISTAIHICLVVFKD